MIFVFGSNEAGIHGAGAAAYAVKVHHAKMGEGVGLVGNSYAIPTKGKYRVANGRYAIGSTLPLHKIRNYVNDFIYVARQLPHLEFQVTQIGCGLAGLKAEDIAPMFANAPSNCWFDEAWRQWLPNKRFWGTF